MPDSLDIALWDATVTGPNTTTMTTGQNWGGIRVTNPGGPVTINGPQLELTNWNFMARTIDLSAATANLTSNGRVEIDGIHEWNVGGGRTLTVARVEAPFGPVDLVKSGEGNLRINAPLNFVGTLQIADGTVSIASAARISCWMGPERKRLPGPASATAGPSPSRAGGWCCGMPPNSSARPSP